MFSLPAYNPSVPFMAFIPGGLAHGSRVRIRGVMPNAADRFTVDLQCGDTYMQHDIALHLSVRPTEGVLVRNSYEFNAWGAEERIRACPIYFAQPFDLEIHIEYTRYSIKVNGQHYCDFNHRFSLSRVTHIRIGGDTILYYVGTEGAHHGEYVPPPFAETYPPPPGYPPPPHHHHHHHHRPPYEYYD
ncbi:unnamed protein product [Hermetia illucens]|uniref:Galectin n=1 Tax=Hermetia illucens TaxID=343691 RepID=A0A7R8UWX4_HERIL|nr:galectin-4-like isoform X2 [Hermetia illucens]CAD7088620.1 unnamed protein product [Hermetia illucens]